MRRTARRRLAVNKQTLRNLGARELAGVVGGGDPGPGEQAPSQQWSCTCDHDGGRDPTTGTVGGTR